MMRFGLGVCGDAIEIARSLCVDEHPALHQTATSSVIDPRMVCTRIVVASMHNRQMLRHIQHARKPRPSREENRLMLHAADTCGVKSTRQPRLAHRVGWRADQMAQVRFTQNIQRHVACPPREVNGGSLREVLDAYFNGDSRAKGYVLDDDGSLRQHMAVFIN